jgi:hypothetical protein
MEPPESGEACVCVLSVDSPHGYNGELLRTYYSYKNEAVAKLFAGKFTQQMEEEGFASIMRGVFLQSEDGDWKTMGSYFDV